MGSPQAFLSYTRTDDEFHGGAISALRNALELGVRVVTGNTSFEIFQDIDGLELGQHWKKRLGQALDEATFLIPIMTPLFFNSPACRGELGKFIAGERKAKRKDLILPIYFVTTPLLEKGDQRAKDRLAIELGKRQWWDWRPITDLPITDPKVRKEIRNVCEQIARALDRAHPPAALSPSLERKRERQFKDNAEAVKKTARPRAKKPTRKVILWVDDRPDNNIYEREAMARYNFDFVLALSTEQALEELSRRKFDAIISDMGRPPDLRAGYTLLQAVRDDGNEVPYFIYAGSRDPAHVAEARRRGAQGTTNLPDELIGMVLDACGPKARRAVAKG